LPLYHFLHIDNIPVITSKLIFILVLLLFTSPVWAGSGLTITCHQNKCFKSRELPIFNLANLSPGVSAVPIIVSVVNLSPKEACDLSIIGSGPAANANQLAQIILALWPPSGSLVTSPLTTALKAGTIPPNTSVDYPLSVLLSPQAGNALQGLTLNADFNFDFTCPPAASISGQVLGTSTSPAPSYPFLAIIICLILFHLWLLLHLI
jgi:hypothetical protein